MVTMYEMIENEMGYRVSKSSTLSLVKEQRADGSYRFTRLRCALMAFEKRYQFKILSKLSYNLLIKSIQINKENRPKHEYRSISVNNYNWARSI
jgi:hypothetical protein